MAMKIRLARGGSKKRPFYRIVAADSRMPRDGRFIEKLGTYNPLLPKDSEDRVKMDIEKIEAWIAKGAQPRFGRSSAVRSSHSHCRTGRCGPKARSARGGHRCRPMGRVRAGSAV